MEGIPVLFVGVCCPSTWSWSGALLLGTSITRLRLDPEPVKRWQEAVHIRASTILRSITSGRQSLARSALALIRSGLSRCCVWDGIRRLA